MLRARCGVFALTAETVSFVFDDLLVAYLLT